MANMRYKQSAALAYRIKKGKLRFLLVTTTNRKRWVPPKGMVDRGLTASQSAAKEAYEEAGVVGKIEKKPIGAYVYQKWGADCDVKVYLLRVKDVLDKFPERHVRQREWMSPRVAAALVKEPELRRIIRRATKQLKAEAKKKD